MLIFRARIICTTLIAASLCIGCSSGGDGATAGNEALSGPPAPAAPAAPAASTATPAITAADLTGDWGHASTGESPDGPISISFAPDGTYSATMQDGEFENGEKGTVTFFANATDASAIVSFLGPVQKLPDGAYVLLRTAADAANLFRVTPSADEKQLTFEPAAKQDGQGLHASGELGPKDTLDKGFDPGPIADAVVGKWDRSDTGPDGPVSIQFDKAGTYDANVREDGNDSPQHGMFLVLPTAADAAEFVSFVGEVSTLPDGAYVLLQFEVDGADLYRISLAADGKSFTLESAARRRGQGLHGTGTLDPPILLTKN
jgi:hypothetical protein